MLADSPHWAMTTQRTRHWPHDTTAQGTHGGGAGRMNMMTEQKLNELYERFGYRKFKMTKFEPYDLYADNRDFLKSSQLITFTDLDGSLLALDRKSVV